MVRKILNFIIKRVFLLNLLAVYLVEILFREISYIWIIDAKTWAILVGLALGEFVYHLIKNLESKIDRQYEEILKLKKSE